MWHHVDEPSPAQCEEIIEALRASSGGDVHEVVLTHLAERQTDPSHAFPRLEDHLGRYLFGHLYIPTSIDDGDVEFAELTALVSFDSTWTILRAPGSTATSGPPSALIEEFRSRLTTERASAEGRLTNGAVVTKIFTLVIDELETALEHTDEIIHRLDQDLDQLSHKHLSRALREQVPGIAHKASDTRAEVSGLGTVVEEMDALLREIVEDRLDLRRGTDDGGSVELFDRNSEISMQDLSYRCRRLRLVQGEQLERLGYLFDVISQLRDADEVTSGRFMGAIASIMLLPTFIVGLYGMNFEFMPELHWGGGYAAAIAAIVAVTIGQIWYFRRKRWI